MPPCFVRGPSGRSFDWSIFRLNTDSLKLHQSSSTLKKFIDGSVPDGGREKKKEYCYGLKDVPLKFKLGRIKSTYFRTFSFSFFSYFPFLLISMKIMIFQKDTLTNVHSGEGLRLFSVRGNKQTPLSQIKIRLLCKSGYHDHTPTYMSSLLHI